MALLAHAEKDVATGTTNATTTGVNTVGATLIVLGTAIGNPIAAFTISDSQSNTWTALNTVNADTTDRVQIFYCLHPNTAASHTFTIAMATGYHTIFMAAFDGSWVFDAQSGGSGATTTCQPGSITPAGTDLFFTVVGSDDSPSGVAIDSSFTTTDLQTNTSNEIGGAAYLVSSSAQNPTWTLTGNSSKPNCAMAAFAPSNSPGNVIRRVQVGDGMSRSELAS